MHFFLRCNSQGDFETAMQGIFRDFIIGPFCGGHAFLVIA
jgi:hypothetical protein